MFLKMMFKDLFVKTARFALNKDKQVNGLEVDASLPDYDIVVNDDDKNVNVQCSTAFYDAVAKPVICGLAKGTTLNIDNISIDCNHIDYNRDSNGFEYNRVLHIGIGGGGKFSIGKVTIHLHHSKRLLQMQGSAVMPDGNRSPVCFLNTFVKERFSRLGKLKHYDITAMNEAVRKAVNRNRVASDISNNCYQCTRQFSNKAKPTKCIFCSKFFHKTNCLHVHSSSCSSRSSSVTNPPAASQSVTQSTGQATPANPLKRQRTQTTSTIAAMTPTVPTMETFSHSKQHQSSSSPQTPAGTSTQAAPLPAPASINRDHASTRSEPQSSLPTTAQSITTQSAPHQPTPAPPASQSRPPGPLFSVDVSNSNLNPIALPFVFSGNGPTVKPKQGKKAKPNPTPFSPEAAKINYLNLELNSAKTRIVQLETEKADRDVTIRIQREKIRILEQDQLNLANSSNSSNTLGSNLTSTNEKSCSHQHPPHCSPLLPGCCHPAPLYCQHAVHHHCHQQPVQPQGPEAADSASSVTTDQLSVLNEIKNSLRNIQDGIGAMAANNIANTANNMATSASTNHAPDINSDPVRKETESSDDHIEVISVEIIENLEDSIASADELVPDSPSTQTNLNCSVQTNQLI